ncbi:MAG TPA: hypothetical protein VFJ43_15350, partial [Bacteroidia bacterium]|nr:hypothetical protein [Bacteroidia bacterium]
QQPYLDNITDLLGSFPADSLCKDLHSDFIGLKKIFPKGPNIPASEFSAELKTLREQVAEIRNRIIKIK